LFVQLMCGEVFMLSVEVVVDVGDGVVGVLGVGVIVTVVVLPSISNVYHPLLSSPPLSLPQPHSHTIYTFSKSQ
jgi:hypothetical protein